FDEPARGQPPEIRERGRLHEFGQPHQPAREFTESRTHQNLRLERVVVRPVEYKHRMHFAGGNLVGEARREERPGAHANVHIQVIQRQPSQRPFQRDERADLVDGAQGTAPSEGDPQLLLATLLHCTTPGPSLAPSLPASCGEFTRLSPWAPGPGRGSLPLRPASWWSSSGR